MEVVIVHRVEQGSAEWKALRVGVVTASAIEGVLTPKELKPSRSAAYFQLVVAERLIGQPCDDFDGSMWTDRGTAMEDKARSWYAFERGVEVDRVGFITTDDGRVGCSPDGLVGADGGIELKCPAAKTHVGYALDPASLAAAYRGQTQVFLFVTGRAWVDLVSYNEPINPVVVRVTPDADYQRALAEALAIFHARVDEAVARLAPNVVVNPLA